MRVVASVLGWIAGVLGMVLVIALALALVLIRSQPGHDFFLRVALEQATRLLQGEVSVGRLSSPGLLRGFTLHEVSVNDLSSRPFLSADSIRVRYSISDLVRRNIVLVPVEIWSPSVVIEMLHGDELSNIRRIIGGGDDPASPEPATEPAGPEAPITVALRQTEIHGGELLLRFPMEGRPRSGRGLYEHIDGVSDGDYRLFRFDQIHARITGADFAGPDPNSPSVRVDKLSFAGWLLDEPLTISEMRGDLVIEGSSVRGEFDRLWMPGSEMAARIDVHWGGADGVEIEGEVEADIVSLADFRWLEPRLPAGGGRMDLKVSGPLDRLSWRVSGADLEIGSSRLVGDLGLDVGSELLFADTQLQLQPLDLHDLSTWLPEPLPYEGQVTGSLQVAGPLRSLRVGGQIRFDDADREIPASHATFDGTVQLSGGLGATDLTIVVDPLRYGTVRAFLPNLEIGGEGRARFRVAGQLSSVMQLSGQLEHELGFAGRSVVSISGTVQPSEQTVSLALAATLEPLSLDGIGNALGRSFPISGEVSGSLRAAGPVSDLVLSATLTTRGGPIQANARLDLSAPWSRYQLEASLEEYRLDQMIPGLPDPTILAGEVSVDGAGGTPEDLRGNASAVFRDIRIGPTELTDVEVRLQVEGGRLRVEELNIQSPVIVVTGSGDLALRDDQPDGSLSIHWAADSLSTLRPALLGEEVIAADTLTQLERDILRLDGINPDTLGAVEQVALAGSAFGELTFRGRLRDVEGEGFAEIRDAVFGGGAVAHTRADLVGSWRGVADWSAQVVLDFDSLAFGWAHFQSGSGGMDYASSRTGSFNFFTEGPHGERYVAEGGLEGDSLGFEVPLRVFEASLDSTAWTLDYPVRLRIQRTSISMDRFRLAGGTLGPSGEGSPSFIEAAGVLDLDGESDFELTASSVELFEIAGLAQLENFPSGSVDLLLAVQGQPNGPRFRGEVIARDLLMGETALSRVEGRVDYYDQSLLVDVRGDLDGKMLFSVEGLLPVDLSFGEVAERFPDEEIDLVLQVDSLPASTALAFIEQLEGVEGWLDGTIQLKGTSRDLRPGGEIHLTAGGLSIPGIGLRPRDLTVALGVREDFQVEVEAQAVAGGDAQVSGTISFDELTDPEFRLVMLTSGFQAVDRRDLTARISGQVQLAGPFSEPLVNGSVQVEQGELFLEEFIRGAEVIDLSDPRFFDVVDTMLVSVPTSDTPQNAFLQNLRVDVDLSLQQDFWIRSQGSAQGMDLEIGGDLDVTFDRPAGELLLAGSLAPIRGSFTQFGRAFEVQAGAIEFVGTPGINPSLSIQATHRLRRRGAEPMNVAANVGGTLQSPQVTLSSDSQPPIPESDLISYLLFGRPSYALASGEMSVVESAAAGLGGAVLSLGVSQLGSTFSRTLGVDYLSVSQAQRAGGLRSFGDPSGLFADTEIEMGRYVGENVFLSVVLRPLTGPDSSRRTLPGARVEWRFEQFWSLRGFVEDRLTRPGGSGFGELDNNFARVFGLSLFGDWGY